MRHLLYLLALAAVLPASAQKAPVRQTQKAKTTVAAKAKVKTKATPATEPVLVFQRTPCYGRCPAYKATIFADGRVEYDGDRSVPLLGKHTLQLPVATVNQLLAEAKRIHFNELKDNYKGNTTDLPATLIAVHLPGQPLKTVFAEEDIPQNLQAYINYLGSKIDPLSRSGVEQ